MHRNFIWLNFAAAVWLLIGVCVYDAAMNLTQATELNEQFGPFSARVALWPLAVGTIELLLWFRPFRHREPGSRVMAGFMGLVLILYGLLVPLLVSDVYDDEPINWPEWLLFLYIAASHLAFAFSDGGHR